MAGSALAQKTLPRGPQKAYVNNMDAKRGYCSSQRAEGFTPGQLHGAMTDVPCVHDRFHRRAHLFKVTL
jgi:hypothetical protein